MTIVTLLSGILLLVFSIPAISTWLPSLMDK